MNVSFLTQLSAMSRPLVFWGYLLLLATAEVITATSSPLLGMSLHALLLVGLTLHGALGQQEEDRRLAMALTLAPLTRLLSLAMPLAKVPQVAWYPLISIPLLISAGIIIRALGISRHTLGLRLDNIALQLMLAGGGLGLGVAEYIILQPTPMVTTLSVSSLGIAALSLLIFTGFNEEFIFRGLLQPTAAPVLSRWAIVYVALLFAVLHIGYLSLIDFVFVLAVGLLFGQIVRWTNSIIGVTLAHGLTNITMFLVMPYANTDPVFARTILPWIVGGGTAAALCAVYILLVQANATHATPPVATASNHLRELRRQYGLTYSELGQRTGISVRLLAEIEHGLRLPQADDVHRIAQALGVAPHQIVPGNGAVGNA